MKNISFVWPQEPYLPQGLFKHFVYLGETAQYTRQFGNVKIFDLSVRPESRNTIVEIARQSDYIFIPVEAYTAISGVKLSKIFEQHGNAIRIAYGSIASVNPRVLEPHFDLVLAQGNWERAIKKLITEPSEFETLLDGKICNYPVPIDGSEWAHPPLDLLPMEEYLKVHSDQLEIRVQRGCFYNCDFCGEKYRVPEKKIYHRSPEDTADFVSRNLGYTYYLDATTFTQDRRWAIETAEAIGGLGVKWRTVTRADKVDREIAEVLGKNGCTKIGFGVETLSADLQRGIRKVVEVETIANASKYLLGAGVIPRAFLIMGLPNQTAEDVLSTQEIIEGLGIEYRWKEYIPFEKIATLKSIEEFAEFERTRFPKHEVPGLTNETYGRLLSKER